MMQPEEFLLRLSLCPGVGPVGRYRLWRAAEASYCFERVDWLAREAGLSVRSRQALATHWSGAALEQLVDQNRGQSRLTILDPDYPVGLRESYSPPLVLYYRGDLQLLRAPSLAVVGARDASDYGRVALGRVLPGVVNQQVAIVSGLARGIDTLSHQLALARDGMPIAVIGNGLDQTYPPENRDLQEMVARRGLLLTEYPLGSRPLPHHFPTRNRIIAGLCQTCLVVEGRQKSGSLITASIAMQENRNVCAIPGPITSDLAVGPNELIAAGAKPILCARDLLDEFGSEIADPPGGRRQLSI